MSQDRSTAIVRAIGIPDPRLLDTDALWTAETTWPEQGPRPARPVDAGSSSLVLSAYGTREDTDTIELVTTKAGSIDPLTGAGFAWREEGDPLYRGRVAPSSIWGWDTIHYVDGSSTTTGEVTASKAPHAVTTSTGTVLVTSQVSRYSTGESVQVSRFTEATGAWATQNVFTVSAAPTQDYYPALCVVDRPAGERILLFYWLEDTTSKTIQVAMRYSDDDGQTWSVGSSACLRDPLYDGEVAGARIRAAYRNGQVVLFAQVTGQDPADAATCNDHLLQYGSIDDGASFRLVVSGQGTDALEGAYPDVVATPTGFVLVFVSINSTGSEPYTQQRRIPDAFTPYGSGPRYVSIGDDTAGPSASTKAGYLQVALGDLGSSQPRQVPGSGAVASSKYTFTRGDVSLTAAPNGTLYLTMACVHQYVNLAGSTITTFAENELTVVRSVDEGLTWDVMGKSDVFATVVDAAGRPDIDLPGSGVLWRTQDTASYLRNVAATWWRGRMLVAHQWNAAPGNEDNSLCVLAAGGYSTVTLPRTAIARDETTMAAWTLTWLPVELPGDLTSWTAAGAGTDALSAGANRVTTTGLNARNYTNSDTANGYIVRAALTWVTGTALFATTRVAIALNVGGTFTDYQVELRFTNTGIQLYDVNAAAALGSASIDTTAGVEVVVAVQDGEAAFWYRPRGVSEDSQYIAGASGSITDAGGPASSSIVWGTLGNQSATVDWHEMHLTRSEGSNTTDYSGQVFEILPDMRNPEDLNAVVHSPTGVYVTDGIYVRATGGPAFEGDAHSIGTASDYPISRVFPSSFPSPRRGTRTVDDNTQAEIAVAYDTKSAISAWNSAPMSDAMCLVILGANWRTAYVERYNATLSTWGTIATIDMATDLSWLTGAWNVYGASIRADGSLGASATQTYLEPNEFNGATLELNGGALRRITSNTEGSTRGTLAGRIASINFDGADGTESANVVRIWSSNACVWWNNLGTNAQGYRLRIPAQTTIDGDLRVGTLMWCNVHPFGTPYSFGRVLGQEHGVQVVEAEDRTYRTRTLAPSRRSVTISWRDGVPTCNASGESPDPDYIKLSDSSGALPVASPFDLPMTLRGYAEQVNGPAAPVVYLPRIEKGPPDSTVLNRRRDFLAGTLDSDVQLDTVRGAENENEYIRLNGISIQEIV